MFPMNFKKPTTEPAIIAGIGTSSNQNGPKSLASGLISFKQNKRRALNPYNKVKETLKQKMQKVCKTERDLFLSTVMYR
jgi:hypothetical protein